MQQNKNQQLDAKFRKFIKVLIMGFIGIYSIINTPISLEKAMQKDSATANMQSTVEQILTTIKYYTENK